jgi:tol-pal system protein YbgF
VKAGRNQIVTIALAALAALLLVGCASRGEIETMQNQLNYLERSSTQTQNRLNQLDSLYRLTIEKNVTYQADLKDALKNVLDQMDIISSRLTDMERRINDLAERQGLASSSPVSSPPTNTTPPSSPPTNQEGGEPIAQQPDTTTQPGNNQSMTTPDTTTQQSSLPQIDKQKMFDNAFDDLRAGNFELAKMGFEEFIKMFPDTPITDDAQYWLAECYYGNGEYAKAIPQFEAVDKNYPKSDKLPPALFKLARSYEQTDQPARAVQIYERIVKDFPHTFEADQAAKKLAELRDESH